MIQWIGSLFAGIVGLAFGSFLNVCLSRWPEGESVVAPRSHCGQCGRVLAWWENVPLVSWIALRGRCRTCKSWIGWRTLLVEAAVGGLWALCAARAFPADAEIFFPNALLLQTIAVAAAWMFFCWLLVALLVLDAENFWLPDALTIPGTVLGLLMVFLQPWMLLRLSALTGVPLTAEFFPARFGVWTPGILRLLAVLVAAGLILLIRWLYWLVRRREGLGLGDAKLMALLAAWLGLPGALLAFVLGITLATGAALALLLWPRLSMAAESWSEKKLPLGTFLCLGGIGSFFWGQPILAVYLRWAGF